MKFPNFLDLDVHEVEEIVPPILEEIDMTLVINTLAVIEKDDDLLQSLLILEDAMANYKHTIVKLKRDLAAMDFADHKWKLKTDDQHSVAIVKYFSGSATRKLEVLAMSITGQQYRTCLQILRNLICTLLCTSNSGTSGRTFCT